MDDRLNLYEGDNDVEYVCSQPTRYRQILVAIVACVALAGVLTYLL